MKSAASMNGIDAKVSVNVTSNLPPQLVHDKSDQPGVIDIDGMWSTCSLRGLSLSLVMNS